MKRVVLQPAYILHRRPYRESSFLVEMLTQEYGRITAVARGVRKAKQGALGLLQQFLPVSVSWTGNGDLVTLAQIEARASAFALQGECLYAGIYLNELLTCLLHKNDAHPALFHLYENALNGLLQQPLQQKVLRSFEKNLLAELGYGILPATQNALEPEKFYRFVPDQGFVQSDLGAHLQNKANIFAGKNLLAIAKEDWQNEESLQDAKRLMRLMLAPLLGARQIYSRQLFMGIEIGQS